MNRILFAGGGTAGHIEPAWAVSQVWQHRFPGDEVAFLGTKSGLEVNLIPDRNGKLFLIPKVVAPRKLNLATLAFPIRLVHSIFKTISIVRNFDLVVGFGGYVAASAYAAAALLRKPIVIHEQNAKVGLANKFGNIFAKTALVAYPNAAEDLDGAKVVGNPLRAEIVLAAKAASENWESARNNAKVKLGLTSKLILILGGSSGSQAINDVVAKADFGDYEVLHSVGKGNELPREIPNRYHAVNYIEDMATALLAADLIISRSGAIATSEIAALGKYALFVPLAIGNGEQAENAKVLVATNRAEIIEQKFFTPTWLTENLNRLLKQGNTTPIGTNFNSAELIADSMAQVLL